MATRTQRTRKPPARSGTTRRLERYNAKRNLEISGEPAGGSAKPSGGEIRRFVIQKHDATRLHYDFRLEMDGVYRSWAVPKGLPEQPGGRSLAVEVEDHPLEYGNFEGVIPAGNYGGGTVMLWDRGHYSVSGVSPEVGYRQGKLHMALAGEKCVGEWTLVRLPRRGEAKTNWLVIKNAHATPHEAPMTGDARDLSVLSGRSLVQIAGGSAPGKKVRPARGRSDTKTSDSDVGGVSLPRGKKPPERGRAGAAPPTRKSGRAAAKAARSKSKGDDADGEGEAVSAGAAPLRGNRKRGEGDRLRAKAGEQERGAPPARGLRAGRPARVRRATADEHLPPAKFIAPMKALNVDTVPAGRWRLEIKFDGFRALALINDGEVELWSRNHKPLTEHYPEVVEALRGIRCANAVIDGEIVALDEQGHSRFQLLQNRGSGGAPIVYYAFDLLHHDGRSLLNTPIEERQMALEVLIGKGSESLRFSTVFEIAPETLLGEVRKKGLEGIIAKTPGSLYEPDRRSGTWLKCKVHGEQEFVIGGFTPPKSGRPNFGAILVGYYEGGKLLYAGKVGSGFDHQQLGELHREFLKRKTEVCPFANLPAPRKPRYGVGMTAAVMKKVTWVKPELVAQVQFTEWTNEGSLRHPVFLGLRDDKKPRDVVREQGA